MKVKMQVGQNFDLAKTLTCGQCFRWIQEGPQKFLIIVNNNLYQLYQSGEYLSIDSTDSNAEETLYNYFALDTEYNIEVPETDTFATEAMQAGKGIKILRQDPFEALISFIISQRNNIPKIKSTINRISTTYGEPISIELANYPNGVTFHTFPTPKKIVNRSAYTLDECGVGYRTGYIYGAARTILQNPSLLGDLKTCSSAECVARLQEFRGIGPKVANCVALFGLGHLDCFPIDIWMQRVIDKYYGGYLDPTVYGKYAGVMQQYMFYYMKYGKGEN